MEYSLTFARHFSRLVWLLLHESTAINEQKAALRAILTISKEGAVTLSAQDWRLVVNGSPLPEALTGVQDLAAQLIGHALSEIRIEQDASPADVLGLARILAAEPVPGDGGRSVMQKLTALDARTVSVVTDGAPDVSMGALSPSLAAGDEPRPVMGLTAEPSAAAAVSSGAEPRTSGEQRTSGGFITDPSAIFAFAAVPVPTGSAADLLSQLDGTRSVNATTRLLDELVTMAENAQREGRIDMVADVFHGVVKREATTSDAELKRAYVMAVRRMAKPTLLRAVAQMLPKNRDRLDEFMEILTRTGEDGADALIEQLTSAPSLHERRVYFDSLVTLNAGVSALIHMLGDARWYVARNAADLLGEMQAVESETQLSDLLKHDDDRVRRAAASALAKLGTPKAMQALRLALRDSSAEVRKQAAAGLSVRKGQKSATTLAKALDEETDAEVQLAILGALGKLGTPDAVQKLIKAAEPEGRLFKKKAVDYRVAAVQALGDARSPAALSALQGLLNDKERQVREAVFRVVMQTQGGREEKAPS